MAIFQKFRLLLAKAADILPPVHPPGLCRKVRSLTAGFFCAKGKMPLYTKPPLTLEAQADLLIARGMRGDRALMIERLRVVSYYRLSGYWYPFRSLPGDEFKPGTNFDDVWNRYVFDRRLRLLVLDAIERFEVALRTEIAYHHSHAYGPFAYATEPSSLPKLKGKFRDDFMECIDKEIDRSKETFKKHFFSKYGSAHQYLPIWMVVEVTNFGTVMTMYNNADVPIQKAIAGAFGVSEKVLANWLLTFNAVRNICAHHSRLWNRELGIAPVIPKKRHSPHWHTPVTIPNDRIFAVLTICRYILKRIAPQSHWASRLQSLLAEHPSIPLEDMEFISNWESHDIWQLVPRVQDNA